jgi:hypothetical protein
MRPAPGSNDAAAAQSRSRKSSFNEPPPPGAGPTAFFLAREDPLEKLSGDSFDSTRQEQQDLPVGSIPNTKTQDSVYGVQSLDDALGAAFGSKDESEHANEDTPRGAEEETTTASSPHRNHFHGTSPVYPTRVHHAADISQPPTPLQSASPAPDWSSAMPSTPKSGSLGSLRLSDIESQAAIDDSDDDYEQHLHQRGDVLGRHSGSLAPELVMPSLAMPARRPFTDIGKKMGRLRIGIAGAKGNLLARLAFLARD